MRPFAVNLKRAILDVGFLSVQVVPSRVIETPTPSLPTKGRAFYSTLLFLTKTLFVQPRHGVSTPFDLPLVSGFCRCLPFECDQSATKPGLRIVD